MRCSSITFWSWSIELVSPVFESGTTCAPKTALRPRGRHFKREENMMMIIHCSCDIFIQEESLCCIQSPKFYFVQYGFWLLVSSLTVVARPHSDARVSLTLLSNKNVFVLNNCIENKENKTAINITVCISSRRHMLILFIEPTFGNMVFFWMWAELHRRDSTHGVTMPNKKINMHGCIHERKHHI